MYKYIVLYNYNYYLTILCYSYSFIFILDNNSILHFNNYYYHDNKVKFTVEVNGTYLLKKNGYGLNYYS